MHGNIFGYAPSFNKRLKQLVQVSDCSQQYSDYERQEVPTQFSTPVLDIIEVINLLGVTLFI